LLLIPLLLAAVVPYAGAKFCRFLPVDGQLSVLQSLTVEHEGSWEGSVLHQTSLRVSVVSGSTPDTNLVKLAAGETLTLQVRVPSSADGSGDGSELEGSNDADDADDGYTYSSEYGYADDEDDDAQTGQPAVLYFPAQATVFQLLLTPEGGGTSEAVSIATDPIPSHGIVYGNTANLRVIGFTDNLGRECRNGVLIRGEDSCVSVPSDTCTDKECCRGMVCTVMPSGPNRCRIADVPGLGLLPTRPATAIPEPTNGPKDAKPPEDPINVSIIVGITLAIAALVVLVGIIVARTYKRDDDGYGDRNNKIVLTLDDDDCTTVYASEAGWESSHFASRNHSRLDTGRSSTSNSAYSNMPHNPPGRRISRSSDLVANKFQWKHSSHGDVV